MKLTILGPLMLGLVALVTAKGPKPDWDAETYKYHGEALLETWIGRNAINVGGLTTGTLYNQLKEQIEKDCPGSTNYCDFKGKVHNIPTEYAEAPGPGVPYPTKFGNTNLGFVAHGKWEDEQIRRLLIDAVASTAGMLTSTSVQENCYFTQRGNFCNIGEHIRVNLPDIRGKQNFMRVDFYGDRVYSSFRCCKTRYKVDQGLDRLGHELSNIYDKPFSRVVRCTIEGMTTCEGCGSACDSCGAHC